MSTHHDDRTRERVSALVTLVGATSESTGSAERLAAAQAATAYAILDLASAIREAGSVAGSDDHGTPAEVER